MHLTWPALAIDIGHPTLRAAGGAAPRLVHQSLLLIKFLLAGGEDKVLAAFAAAECLIHDFHWVDLL
jgi:hypothetical protein